MKKNGSRLPITDTQIEIENATAGPSVARAVIDGQVAVIDVALETNRMFFSAVWCVGCRYAITEDW
jgi:hypothetical protein